MQKLQVVNREYLCHLFTQRALHIMRGTAACGAVQCRRRRRWRVLKDSRRPARRAESGQPSRTIQSPPARSALFSNMRSAFSLIVHCLILVAFHAGPLIFIIIRLLCELHADSINKVLVRRQRPRPLNVNAARDFHAVLISLFVRFSARRFVF